MFDPPPLNLRHLRALVEAVRKGSISAAADAVGLSQPALTQGLAKLERQIGMPLLDRQPGGVRALPGCQAFTDRAALAQEHLARAMRGIGRSGNRGFARPDQLATNTQLRAFLAFADTGGFAAAAARTGLSQPAIHRAVRDLEQICAVTLAERRGRGMQLTAAGLKVARGVRLALGEIATAVLEITGREDAGRLVIGAMPLSRALVLPRAIADFLAGSPRVAVEVVEGSWRELAEPLHDGLIDLMVGALRDEVPAGLEQRPLFDDQLIVVGRKRHPLAAAAHPTLDDFGGFPWIVGVAGSPLRRQWEGLFDGRAPPATSVECGSVMVNRGLLARSDLLTLLSTDQVALEIASGMLTRIGPPLAQAKRTIGITVRSGWRPTAAQQRFVDLLARPSDDCGVQEVE